MVPSQPHGIFGPPISAEDKKKKDERSRAMWAAKYEDAKPPPKPKAAPKAAPKSLIKQKEKKKPPAGVVVATGAQDHTKKLIGNGQQIPLIKKDSPPQKQQPKVKHESTVTYARGTKRKAPEPPLRRSTLRKTNNVTTASTRRRVAAADV